VDSPKIDRLAPEPEVFYYRLLVVADDFGRMDARPAILRARCFPLKETLSAKKLSEWLEAVWEAVLIGRYEVDGQPYVQVLKWDQRVRSSGKYPPPIDGQMSVNCQTDDGQMPAHVRGRNTRVGLGLGLGLGASDNTVVFDAASGQFSIPELLMKQWRGACPALSLDVELSKASAWLIANPKNQKSNYARFLTNWLSKAQDRAPKVANGAGAGDLDAMFRRGQR
jgi:hypothetical protein